LESSTINTNTLALTTDPVSLLAPYTAHRYQIYHCPADRYVSPVQAARGWPYRVRSVSMSCAIGDGGSGPGGGQAPEFPWAVKILKTKLTDLRVPGPGEVWVFLDEAPDSINDPMFYNNPDATGALDGTANGGNWIDFPSSLHDGGGTFSFADGHAGLHRWLDTNTRATAAVKYTAGVATPGSAPVDVAWLSAHTPLP
jgi:prepilin-type processing-associated H-X9-DG protein